MDIKLDVRKLRYYQTKEMALIYMLAKKIPMQSSLAIFDRHYHQRLAGKPDYMMHLASEIELMIGMGISELEDVMKHHIRTDEMMEEHKKKN